MKIILLAVLSVTFILSATPPDIVYSNYLEKDVNPGSYDADTFNIGNAGTDSLNYDLSFEYTDVMSQVIYGSNEHFDFGLGNFTASGTGILWAYSTTTPVYETGYARVTSANNGTRDTYLTSGAFNISGLRNPTLSFAYLWNGSGLTTSYLTAEYSTDGTNYTILTTYDVADQLTWATASFDIPDNAIKVRFHCVYPKVSNLYAGVDVIQVKGNEQFIEPWFSFVSPTIGSVEGGSNTDITCGFDATDLPFWEEFHGQITINSNDPETPVAIIVVTLTTFGDPVIPYVTNLTTEVSGNDLILSWDYNPLFSEYIIHSSAEPYDYGAHTIVDTTSTASWTTPITNEKRFYYIGGLWLKKTKTP